MEEDRIKPFGSQGRKTADQLWRSAHFWPRLVGEYGALCMGRRAAPNTPRFWFDAWAGRPIENRPELWPNSDFEAPFAFVLYSGVKGFHVGLMFFTPQSTTIDRQSGESGNGDLLSHSIGFQLQKPAGKGLDYSASFIGQMGRSGNDRIRAFGANSAVGVTLPWKWRPRLAGQFTWGSGDRNPSDGIHGTFDGVFGGADINFYGDLNLFFWANLRDYELDLHLNPHPKVKLMIENHYYTLDQSRDAWYTTGMAALRRDAVGLSGRALGDEINIRLSWQPAKKLDLLTGYGHFFPAHFVKATGPAKVASGYFLQVSYALD